jgi:hypothetical protein
VKAYLATTGVLFAVLAVLHVWRLVVEWPGVRAEFWIIAGGSILSAVLALWALKLLLALKRSSRPPVPRTNAEAAVARSSDCFPGLDVTAECPNLAHLRHQGARYKLAFMYVCAGYYMQRTKLPRAKRGSFEKEIHS